MKSQASLPLQTVAQRKMHRLLQYLPAVLLAIALSGRVAAASQRGVAPEDAHLYEVDGDKTWTCLRSGQKIPISAINDDYCDCDDGSDEPGTSACDNSIFYCHNEGHIPSRILSNRVNDGICDTECCDGSDEYDGKVHCPNVCGPLGKAYRKEQQELANTRRAGSKIRDKYITDRSKALVTLKIDVARLETELESARLREEKAKASLESAESMDKHVTQQKKASPLYGTLQGHQNALQALLDKQATLKRELVRLTELLDDLAKGYNPNYQDMAVKGAVVAYRDWRRGGDGGGEADAKANEVSIDEEEPIKLRQLQAELDTFSQASLEDMIERDPLILMDDDKYKVGHSDEAGILFRIHEYLPDAIVPYFEAAVDTILDLFLKANIITEVKRRSRRSVEGAEAENVSAARVAYRSSQDALRRIESELQSKKQELEPSAEKWGRQGEFKALDKECVSKNMGEYTYEFCFFGTAVQIPNRGHGRVTLGRWGHFAPLNASLTPQDDDYYTRQIYDNGQRCWNGPDRSLIVYLSCAPQNALLDVFEGEKCIYEAKVTTPAVCLPLPSQSSAAGTTKDEL